jgi:hypothetical protein
MLCLARLDAPGVLHHDDLCRGIERKKIFINNRDRKDFISPLTELSQGDAMNIFARALLQTIFT